MKVLCKIVQQRPQGLWEEWITTLKNFISDMLKKDKNQIETAAQFYTCQMVKKCINMAVYLKKDRSLLVDVGII